MAKHNKTYEKCLASALPGDIVEFASRDDDNKIVRMMVSVICELRDFPGTLCPVMLTGRSDRTYTAWYDVVLAPKYRSLVKDYCIPMTPYYCPQVYKIYKASRGYRLQDGLLVRDNPT